MATWRDVRRVALALPETAEDSAHGHTSRPAWKVAGKAFAWDRPLRKSDLEALGDDAPGGAVLAAYVPDLGAKEALLQAEPDIYFTTPHFTGFPAVLVRLPAIRAAGLRELLVEAWLCRAPKRLAKEYADDPARALRSATRRRPR